MAGFFGLFNYEKEGPGIDKNAPKKKTFIVFFETFFRNFWKFISVNFVYLLISLPIVTSGLANVGITNVTRNVARDKHSFMVSDFLETIKKNWKQGLIVGIINNLLFILMILSGYTYFMGKGTLSTFGLGVCLAAFFIFSFMNYFIWTLMITFNFSIKQLYSNSFKLAFVNLPKNLLCGVCILLVYALNIGLLLIFSNWTVLLIEILIAILTFPAFRFLIIQYCTFPCIKRLIIDPYYKDHPGEDIEKRRNLGLEIEEEKNDEEDEENEEEITDE